MGNKHQNYNNNNFINTILQFIKILIDRSKNLHENHKIFKYFRKEEKNKNHMGLD